MAMLASGWVAPAVSAGRLWAAGAVAALGTVLSVSVGASAAVLVVMICSAIAAAIDADQERIPDVVSASAGAAAVVVWWQAGTPWEPIVVAAVAAALLLGGFAFGLGGGDVKLLPSLLLTAGCLFVGLAGAVFAACIVLAAAGAGAVALHVATGRRPGASAPLAPGIHAGMLVVLAVAIA